MKTKSLTQLVVIITLVGMWISEASHAQNEGSEGRAPPKIIYVQRSQALEGVDVHIGNGRKQPANGVADQPSVKSDYRYANVRA